MSRRALVVMGLIAAVALGGVLFVEWAVVDVEDAQRANVEAAGQVVQPAGATLLAAEHHAVDLSGWETSGTAVRYSEVWSAPLKWPDVRDHFGSEVVEQPPWPSSQRPSGEQLTSQLPDGTTVSVRRCVFDDCEHLGVPNSDEGNTIWVVGVRHETVPLVPAIWTYGTFVILLAIVAAVAWIARDLRGQPRRQRSSSAPGVSWFPTGTWWGHRRPDDRP